MIITNYQGDSDYLYNLFFNEKMFNLEEIIAITISGMGGILITIASLLTVTTCGPSALNVSGTLKDVALTYLGFILFDDVKPTTKILVGLALGFSGASTMTYINVFNNMAKAEADKKAKLEAAKKK